MDEKQRPFIQLDNVNHIFEDDGSHVLDNISLAIDAGAFVTLVGSSGVGKSTLLRILGGLLPPTRGEVWLDGRSPLESHAPVGIVFQRDNLMPWRTAYENVRLPLELKGIKGTESDEKVRAMLNLVGLSGYEQSYPGQLSGGMAQRVAIARALVHEPALLLLDEPFGALDALTRERMGQELLRIWHANPVTVFMVTHSIDEAVFLADEVLVMGSADNNGQPATITHHIPIPLPRPRAFAVRRTAEFLRCETAVRDAIQNET